jgi:hypothetical protein
MKKVLLSIAAVWFFGVFANAQSKSSTSANLTGRAADHLMFQIGTDTWINTPDSVKLGSGTSRHFNMYFMYDKPFKSNNKYSVAYGGGIGTNNIFFDNRTNVDLKSNAATLPFRRIDANANHFDKVKVTTIYLQAPLEIRYFSNPVNPGKSWKYAAGVKAGFLFKSYTKSKNFVNSSGSSIYGKSYILKESNRRFFNATDITLTGRAGYGILSFDVGYTVTGVLRSGFGPVMNKFSAGITISGL